MLVGTLEHLAPLAALGGNFATAAAYLQKLDTAALEPQRYDIDGDNVYAFCAEVDLRPLTEAFPEAHRRYADIQLVLDGCEGMAYAPTARLIEHTPYNEEADYALYENIEDPSMLALRAGEFAVFMPEDAHTPCCPAGGCVKSKKLIVKVLL